MKMAKVQTTVDHVSSLMSSEMAKSNNFAALAEKMTAAQSTTTTVVAELVAAREAAAAAVSTAPASTLSEKEITDEQHAQDRVAAKAIKKLLRPIHREIFLKAKCASDVYTPNISDNPLVLDTTMDAQGLTAAG
eukprot:contig_15781_g3771